MRLTKSLMAVLAATFGPVLTCASPISDSTVVNHVTLLSSTSAAKHEIPNSYIVVFKKDVDDNIFDTHQIWIQETQATSLKKRIQIPLSGKPSSFLSGFKHSFNINDGFKGYAGSFDESTINLIRSHPDVEYVEEDSVVCTSEEPSLEKQAPWGLARVSHRETLHFSTFNKYFYSADSGEGVNVYIINTGSDSEHVDFEDRVE
ncbi:Cerevisin [Dactylellina cionopaga]|nr:Cerevisin [Dactylellina cionopaga]